MHLAFLLTSARLNRNVSLCRERLCKLSLSIWAFWNACYIFQLQLQTNDYRYIHALIQFSAKKIKKQKQIFESKVSAAA